ncbi:hypothetical protein [Porphyromonas sp.]|uniref:hypothetical protein n=1 Tax=Porphyromonas sp. TaxID=1924944 RepID=UPI0026DBD66E|nr:hypothetical protein [Porphyromonas sp.]MDO4770565.1 hypothetical protein [Porphyromonas sp.]
MKCSVELSYYPLTDDFKPHIRAFIADLQKHDNIKVEPGSISTRVFGEYTEVMNILTEAMGRAFKGPAASFVIKVLNLDRDK